MEKFYLFIAFAYIKIAKKKLMIYNMNKLVCIKYLSILVLSWCVIYAMDNEYKLVWVVEQKFNIEHVISGADPGFG